MVRTMINETNVANHFWTEAMNTTCYIHNKIFIRPIMGKTQYELWKKKIPTFIISIHLVVYILFST